MGQRVEQRAFPRIEVIDLRAEFMAAATDSPPRTQKGIVPLDPGEARYPLISHRLEEALKDNCQASRQSLIFLNRRGFANFLQCRLCGFVFRCSHCSVSLTLHVNQRSLCCHHCGFRQPVTDICPGCGNSALAGIGVGTERIEEEIRRLLPDARVARMDRDTTSKRGSHEGLIRKWEKGEIDILIGTQMITKGHDVAGVTLVGALLADLSLNLPDFRAAERTFQLLSQVAGRSGRGRDPGRVIIQTYAPEHYAMRHLIDHDYRGFFASEIEFRRALNYPPFARLVQLRLDGSKRDQVESRAKAAAATLRAIQQRDQAFANTIEILGPAPAPIQRLRNRYRWQILLKGKKDSPLLQLARQARENLPNSRSVRLRVDVDPYNML